MNTLMAIGGGINPKNPAVLQEFLRRADGEAARIVILPQASALAETGQYYIDLFHKLGAAQAKALCFCQRNEAGTPEQIELIRNATGIFFTGGNQLRLSVLLGGTPLEIELLAAYRRGCLVCGTSAGAAILSKTMICNGKGGPTPRDGIVQFCPGLGFTDRFTFDQHFRQRDRLGRLAYAVATHPGILGVGIDEDTAAVLENDESITVYGSGGVTIVDGRGITGSDVAEIEKKSPVAISNLKIHILTHGCRYQNSAVFIPEKMLMSE